MEGSDICAHDPAGPNAHINLSQGNLGTIVDIQDMNLQHPLNPRPDRQNQALSAIPHMEWNRGRFIRQAPMKPPLMKILIEVLTEQSIISAALLFPTGFSPRLVSTTTLADSGAQSCCGNMHLLTELGCTTDNLLPTCEGILGVADTLQVFGVLPVRITKNGYHTNQIMYFTDAEVGNLSEKALRDLHILPDTFPSTLQLATSLTASSPRMTFPKAVCSCLQDCSISPTELFNGRKLPDYLPQLPSQMEVLPRWKEIRDAMENPKTPIAERADKSKLFASLKPLNVGQHVLIQNGDSRDNISGTIIEVLPFRQYRIRCDGSGMVQVRNRQHLKSFLPPLGRIPSLTTRLARQLASEYYDRVVGDTFLPASTNGAVTWTNMPRILEGRDVFADPAGPGAPGNLSQGNMETIAGIHITNLPHPPKLPADRQNQVHSAIPHMEWNGERFVAQAPMKSPLLEIMIEVLTEQTILPVALPFPPGFCRTPVTTTTLADSGAQTCGGDMALLTELGCTIDNLLPTSECVLGVTDTPVQLLGVLPVRITKNGHHINQIMYFTEFGGSHLSQKALCDLHILPDTFPSARQLATSWTARSPRTSFPKAVCGCVQDCSRRKLREYLPHTPSLMEVWNKRHFKSFWRAFFSLAPYCVKQT